MKLKSNPTSEVKLPQFTRRHTEERPCETIGESIFPVVPKRKGKAGQEDGEKLRVPGFDSSLQLLNSQRS